MISSIIERIRHVLLSSKSLVDPEQNRSAERHRRALLTGATGLIARGATVGVSIITIPLTLHYLGNERFGLWMTISAVLAMANFADFGIGNGVLNIVSASLGRDDLDGIRRAISSGFAVLTTIAVVLVALFRAVYHIVSWPDLFRVVSPQARAEAGAAMTVFVVCFALNLPLDVVQRVQLGLQQGFRTNAWQILSAVMSLSGVLLAIHFGAGLPALIAAIAGAPVLGTAMNAISFFGFKRRDLLPKPAFIAKVTIMELTRLGGLFFLLQLVGSISSSVDNFIVARALGAAAVSTYSIPQRLFNIVGIPVTMLLVPYWPAYGEAQSRGDVVWIRRTLSKTVWIVAGATTITCAFLLAGSRWILSWWVGPQIHPPMMLMLGLALWTIMGCCSNSLGVFLNGIGVVRFQVITASIFGIGCFAAKVLMVRQYGISAIPWATVLTSACLSILPTALYIPVLLRKLSKTPEPVLVEIQGSW